MLDLAVVVPDKAIEQAIVGLLEHPRKLGVRPIRHTVLSHVDHDPGCFNTGHELLRPFARIARHGLIVFDKAWDGAPPRSAMDMTQEVEAKLESAWEDRAQCIVIDPEVDVWLWTDSPHLCTALGWTGSLAHLRAWLCTEGLWPLESPKPVDPKEAFKRAAHRGRVPPSSSIFRELAGKVSYSRCTDYSFRRLVGLLKEWFPVR